MLKQNVVVAKDFGWNEKAAVAALTPKPRVKLVAVDDSAVPRLKLDYLLAAAKHRVTLKNAVYLDMLVPM